MPSLPGIQGFPRLTAGADITPYPEPGNLIRLAAALRDLDARAFTESMPEGLSFDCSAARIERSRLWRLVTAAGRLDLIFRTPSTTGFDDLAAHAVKFEVFGVGVEVASIEDIARSKVAAGRPQDRQDVIVLREMIRRGLRGPGQAQTSRSTIATMR